MKYEFIREKPVVQGFQVWFPDQNEFRQTFKVHGYNIMEYPEEAQAVETRLQSVFYGTFS